MQNIVHTKLAASYTVSNIDLQTSHTIISEIKIFNNIEVFKNCYPEIKKGSYEKNDYTKEQLRTKAIELYNNK